MKIVFDPANPADVAAVMAYLGGADYVDDDAPTEPAGVDARGVPYIDTVHTEAGTRNKDGSWRRRKGVSAEDCERAEMQARGTMPTPTPTAAFVAPTAPVVAPVVAPVAAPVAPVAAPTAPVAAPTAPVVQVGLPVAAPTVQEITYPMVIAKLTAINTTHPGAITVPLWNDWLRQAGVSDNSVLQTDAAALSVMFDTMSAAFPE